MKNLNANMSRDEHDELIRKYNAAVQRIRDQEFPYDAVSFDIWKHEFRYPKDYEFRDENGNVINAMKIVLEKKSKKSPKTDDIIKWLREHDMTKYLGVIYSGMCSITFDTEKLIKDITEIIGDE